MVPSKILLFVAFFLVMFIGETLAKKSKKVTNKRPSYFPTCYRNDPALSECLINATDEVRPYLVKGIPELKMPPFEPFLLPEISLQLGTRSLNYTLVLKDILVHGLTQYKFTRFDFDVPNLQFFCEYYVPSLNVEGDYNIAGRILITPIVGSGKFTGSTGLTKGYLYQKVKEMTLEDGKTYIVPVFTNGTFDIAKPKAKLDGLFNGNDQLNMVINKVIEDNSEEFSEEFRPVLEQAVVKIADDLIFKTITGRIPYDDLYPIKK